MCKVIWIITAPSLGSLPFLLALLPPKTLPHTRAFLLAILFGLFIRPIEVYVCDYGLGTIHLCLVNSLVGTKLDTMAAPLPESISKE